MKKGFWTAIAVALMSIVLAISMGVYLLVTGLNKEEKYVLYVGVPNATSTVETKLTNICKEHVDGFTLVKGSGGYTNDLGGFVSESTYVLSFNFTNEETVEAIAKRVLKEVENSTVLMETIEASAVHSSTGIFDEA